MVNHSTAHLQVALQNERHIFHPGDEISGTVNLRLNQDSPIGTVCVRFFGRSKAKIVRSNGQSTSTNRGQVDLVNLETIVHSDQFTHKSGDYDFPFCFEIPHLDDLKVSKTKWKDHANFSSNLHNNYHKVLPPSMRFTERKGGSAWEASVAYGIEVEITPPDGAHALKSKSIKVTEWINVLLTPSSDPVDFDDPAQRRGYASKVEIKSFRLLPQHAHHLSLKQRALSTIKSSQVPKFTFDLDVSYNSVVDAYHGASLPFMIAAIAHTDAKSTTIQPTMLTFYRYPNIMVNSFELKLEAITSCRCPSLISDVHANAKHDIMLVSRHFDELRLGARSIALDQKDGREDSAPTSIDLGRECDIFIGKGWLALDSKSTEATSQNGQAAQARGDVIPSFVSYNVSRKYYFVWILELECAGEKVTVKGRSQEEIIIRAPTASASGYDEALWCQSPPDLDDSDDEVVPRRRSERDTLPAYSMLPENEAIMLDSTPIGHGKARRS